MLKINLLVFGCVLLGLLISLGGCKKELKAGDALSINEQYKLPAFKALNYRELAWGDLMPPDYVPISQPWPVSHEGDSQTTNDSAEMTPFIPELNGQEIRLAGYVVPLEGTETAISEFLLVPFVGACIHVPPPPANQIVYVKPTYPLPIQEAYGVIAIVGTMKTEAVESYYGNVNYLMDDALLVPYIIPEEG
ncbi:MAG: DUF3299 domain-containing protein [Deinococcales bacterium]